jgi:hypothetical protein
MPLRLKWYTATTLDRGKIEQLLAGLLKDQYAEGKRSGFTNVILRGTSIEGEYIERFEAVTKIEDPFGKITEYPIVQFERFFFSVGSKFPNLELHGSSRSLGSFLNQIAAYLNFQIAIEPVKVDLLLWLSAIEHNVDSFFVAGALVPNLSLSNSVQSKITFFGSTEVRPFVKKLTGKRFYAFSKVQLNGISHSERFKFELFADGRATVLSGVESEIVKLLRISLRMAVTK